MNNSPTLPKRAASRLQTQASRLSALTRDLTHCCQAKEAEIFSKYDLSPSEGHLLLELAFGGGLSPSVVAERMGWHRSRLTPLADSLVERGYIVRTDGEEDRRQKILKITRTGHAAAKAVAEISEEFHLKLLRTFDARTRDHLLDTLAELHDRIQYTRKQLNRE